MNSKAYEETSMKKRLLALCFVFTFALCACGNTDTASTDASKTSSGASTTAVTLPNDVYEEEASSSASSDASSSSDSATAGFSSNPDWKTQPTDLFIKAFIPMIDQINTLDVAGAEQYLDQLKYEYRLIENDAINTMDIDDPDNDYILTLSFTVDSSNKMTLEIVSYGNTDHEIDAIDLNHSTGVYYETADYINDSGETVDSLEDAEDYLFIDCAE